MIHSSKISILWILLTFLSLTEVYSKGNEIVVCSNCNIKTIIEAVNLSQNNDSILIHEGEYLTDNIVITKQVKLIGINNPVIISKEGDEIITILSDSVTIEGLTLKGVSLSYMKERSAIRVKKKKYFTIRNNSIINCFFGIYLEHAKNGTINDNNISGNATTEAESGNAIHAWYCENITIYNNILMGHRDGIYFEFVNNSSIYDNHSEKNKRYGLHFMFSNDDKYLNNNFIENGVGVAVMFSKRIEMRNNNFIHNWGQASYGLLLKEIYDAEIINNTFKDNTTGIFVEGSNRINYKFNDFERNGWAIKFSGGCETNKITSNNFINNTLDLVVSTRMNDNLFQSNYWSNYSGYDLDKDGVGDIPHYPVKLFSYIINEVPEAILLMRSLFVDIINYTEKVSPVFTPKDVQDSKPVINLISRPK